MTSGRRRSCARNAASTASSGGAAQDGAVALADLDDALHLEGDQRLPHGRAADVQRRGELALRREAVTGGQLQLADEPEEPLDELLVEPRPRHRTQRRRPHAGSLG